MLAAERQAGLQAEEIQLALLLAQARENRYRHSAGCSWHNGNQDCLHVYQFYHVLRMKRQYDPRHCNVPKQPAGSYIHSKTEALRARKPSTGSCVCTVPILPGSLLALLALWFRFGFWPVFEFRAGTGLLAFWFSKSLNSAFDVVEVLEEGQIRRHPQG